MRKVTGCRLSAAKVDGGKIRRWLKEPVRYVADCLYPWDVWVCGYATDVKSVCRRRELTVLCNGEQWKYGE